MHRALVAARLRDPFLAGRNHKQVLDQGYLDPGSMMTNHNPYRAYCPDACGSLPVPLVEELVYSRQGIIELLSLADHRLEIRPPAGWSRETADVELRSGRRWKRRFTIGIRR